MKPEFTILVVNYHTPNFIRNLRIIHHFSKKYKYHIYIWENDVDENTETESEKYAHRVIKSRKNVGHGPGLQNLTELVDSKYLISFDSDAFPIAEDWFDNLKGFLSDEVKCIGILRKWRKPLCILPCCLLIETNFFRKIGTTFHSNLPQYDVGMKISLDVIEKGFRINGWTLDYFAHKFHKKIPYGKHGVYGGERFYRFWGGS